MNHQPKTRFPLRLARFSFALLVLGCGGRTLPSDPVEEASSGGTTATGSRTSAGGSLTNAGGSTNAGGTTGDSCDGAQLLFVISLPMVAANSFSVRYALVGTNGYSGAVGGYWDKLDVGALFFVRRQSGDQVECPVVTSVAPGGNTIMPIANLITSGQDDFQAAFVAQTKMNAPVPEAVAAAASLLTGGNRHLVLITTGAPDSCLELDGKCAVDPSIKAVQDARLLGITTHVIGVGNTDSLSTASDEHGYETYLAQLANAGEGKPVKKSAVFEAECSGKPATAVYSTGAIGDAHAYHTESVGDIDAAIVEILKSICP